MHFAQGTTRWVILFDRYVIKIAKPRLLQPFIGLFNAVKGKDVKQRLENHNSNIILAVFTYLFIGIVSNRNEYLLYKNHGNDLLVPTLFAFLYIFNIQEKGRPATEKDLIGSKMATLLKGTKFEKEVMCPDQFCIINGRLLLLDYALRGFDEVMAAYNARVNRVS